MSGVAILTRLPGEVAQLAEHATENRGVDSSILSLATDSAPNPDAKTGAAAPVIVDVS